MIYDKCWIDTIQWHLEDIIRKPDISPKEALQIKRKIDSSNQDRTDFVEELDDYFFKNFSNSSPSNDAILNTETPAWAIDRLSILALKIYQSKAIDQLFENISKGSVIISTYKQMKMYNDESLNPELYSKDD